MPHAPTLFLCSANRELFVVASGSLTTHRVDSTKLGATKKMKALKKYDCLGELALVSDGR